MRRPVRVTTRADLDISTIGDETPRTVASYQPATIIPVDLDDIDDACGVSIRFDINLGAVADTAELVVPFDAVAEFVDRMRRRR